MQKFEPLVSVMMNCFNGEAFLREAIESVLAQTYTNWEVIFWDNQSSDRSAEIFKSYEDTRLKYFYAPRHTYLYEARGLAYPYVNGELLAFLDVDDRWMPDKLKTQVPLFQNPEVGFSCGNFIVENHKNGKSWNFFKREFPSGRVLPELCKDYFIGLVTLIVRREAIQNFDPIFDPRYHIIGDYDLTFKLAMDWKLATINEPIAYYRLHEHNETSKRASMQVEELECWYHEALSNPKLSKISELKFVREKFNYIKGIHFLLNEKRSEAFACFSQMNWGRPKIRLFLALCLPISIGKMFKN